MRKADSFIIENINAALRGEYGKRVLPSVSTAYDEIHTVVICPVCQHKTLNFHAICCHCGWQHDGLPEDHFSAANGTTLTEYRQAFYQIIQDARRTKQ